MRRFLTLSDKSTTASNPPPPYVYDSQQPADQKPSAMYLPSNSAAPSKRQIRRPPPLPAVMAADNTAAAAVAVEGAIAAANGYYAPYNGAAQAGQGHEHYIPFNPTHARMGQSPAEPATSPTPMPIPAGRFLNKTPPPPSVMGDDDRSVINLAAVAAPVNNGEASGSPAFYALHTTPTERGGGVQNPNGNQTQNAVGAGPSPPPPPVQGQSYSTVASYKNEDAGGHSRSASSSSAFSASGGGGTAQGHLQQYLMHQQQQQLQQQQLQQLQLRQLQQRLHQQEEQHRQQIPQALQDVSLSKSKSRKLFGKLRKDRPVSYSKQSSSEVSSTTAFPGTDSSTTSTSLTSRSASTSSNSGHVQGSSPAPALQPLHEETTATNQAPVVNVAVEAADVRQMTNMLRELFKLELDIHDSRFAILSEDLTERLELRKRADLLRAELEHSVGLWGRTTGTVWTPEEWRHIDYSLKNIGRLRHMS